MLERQLAILQPRFHHHTTIGPKRKAAVRINGPFQNKVTHAKDSVITIEKQWKCFNVGYGLVWGYTFVSTDSKIIL